MVAGGDRLQHDRRVGDQSGQQHARFDLGACDGQLVDDPLERRARHRERGEPPVPSLDRGAHQLEGLRDPVYRSPADGVIAVQLERRSVVHRKPGGE